jgi:hypothetical protein
MAHTEARAPLWQRPARRSEISGVHARLQALIAELPGFTPEFRQFERQRMSKLFLANLHSLDENYIRLCMAGDGNVGFMISGPEYGTLWQYWSALFPEVREPHMPLTFMRLYIEHWDNGCFHKIANITTANNRPAIAMLKRFRFEHVADLHQHVMGQDFLLFERPLNKNVEGYDRGLQLPRSTRLVNRMRCMTGLI